MQKNKNKLIYPDLSYRLTGVFFQVHNQLGRYCREKQYADLLAELLNFEKINFNREYEIIKTGNICDFVIEDLIILELKAKQLVEKRDYNQLQRYLQATGLRLGMLINFQCRYLKPVRIVRIDTDVRKKFY